MSLSDIKGVITEFKTLESSIIRMINYAIHEKSEPEYYWQAFTDEYIESAITDYLSSKVNYEKLKKVLEFSQDLADFKLPNSSDYRKRYSIAEQLLKQIRKAIVTLESELELGKKKLEMGSAGLNSILNIDSSRFKSLKLSYYLSLIKIINHLAKDAEIKQVFPVMLRVLIENLLYDIYLRMLGDNQKFLYFDKNSGHARDLALLIELFDCLAKNEIKVVGVAIPGDIVPLLKEIKKFGNYTAHDIVDKMALFDKKITGKEIKLIIDHLLAIFEKIPETPISLEAGRLQEIIKQLGISSDSSTTSP